MEEGLEIIHGSSAVSASPTTGATSRPTRRSFTLARTADPRSTSRLWHEGGERRGSLGDGLWTLGDPESAPEVIDAYKGACEDAGKEPGEIVLQAQFSWAEDDDAALEGARVWKGAQPDEFYTDDWHDSREDVRGGREADLG